MTYRQDFGKSGENKAAEFLIEQGFTIVERNVRCGRIGEIDLVASKGNLTVLAEVKTRSNSALGGALYSITKKKKHTLRRCTDWYLVSRDLYSNENIFRFDLIAIDNNEVIWVQDILR